MGYLIGIGTVILIGVIGHFLKKIVLCSTLDIFAIATFGVIAWFSLFFVNIWVILAMVFTIILTIITYFSDRKKEQAILNTIKYMITQENYMVISASDVHQKLGYNDNDLEMLIKTLRIYKSKALIPYNIDIIE